MAPELIGCLLVKRQASGELLWGVIVETEAYSQDDPACHGYRRRTPSYETLFGEPGRFYVYVSYGIHHCVNVVTGRADWANGVLLRALALPAAPERCAAGPALLARCFGLDRSHDAQPASLESGLWIAPRPPLLAAWLAPSQQAAGTVPGLEPAIDDRGTDAGGTAAGGAGPSSRRSASAAILRPSALVQTSRIGISQAQELPWRWYLRASRAVSRRAPGDRRPRLDGLVPLLQPLAPGLPAFTVGIRL